MKKVAKNSEKLQLIASRDPNLVMSGREMDFILKRVGVRLVGNASFCEFIDRSPNYYYYLRNGIGNIPLYVAHALRLFCGEELFDLAQAEYRKENPPQETQKNVGATSTPAPIENSITDSTINSEEVA